MNSIILRTASRFLLPIMLVFSLWVLFRGHNNPGGGFIGGLIAGSAFSLYLIAFGTERLRHLLPFDLHVFLGAGLALALASGLLAVVFAGNFFSSLWFYPLKAVLPDFKLGTPLVFDLGIYLAVLASILMIVMAIEESAK